MSASLPGVAAREPRGGPWGGGGQGRALCVGQAPGKGGQGAERGAGPRGRTGREGAGQAELRGSECCCPLSVMRKLQEFELPYVSVTSLRNPEYKIILRKR